MDYIGPNSVTTNDKPFESPVIMDRFSGRSEHLNSMTGISVFSSRSNKFGILYTYYIEYFENLKYDDVNAIDVDVQELL